MTRATTIAVTGVLALAVSGLSVPAASAGDSELIEVKGGYGLFADGGDLLRAVDQRRDGYGVRARLGFSGTSATATAQGVGELQLSKSASTRRSRLSRCAPTCPTRRPATRGSSSASARTTCCI